LQFALDFLLTLDLAPRAALLVVASAAVLHQLWHRVLRPLGTRIDLDRLAATVEQSFPHLRDRLVSAVEFATGAGAPPGARPPDESPAMRGAVIAQAVEDFRQVDPGSLLRRRRFRTFGMVLIGVLALAAGAAKLQPEYFAVYLSRDVLLRD